MRCFGRFFNLPKEKPTIDSADEGKQTTNEMKESEVAQVLRMVWTATTYLLASGAYQLSGFAFAKVAVFRELDYW